MPIYRAAGAASVLSDFYFERHFWVVAVFLRHAAVDGAKWPGSDSVYANSDPRAHQNKCPLP